jgi:hypothetical protein
MCIIASNIKNSEEEKSNVKILMSTDALLISKQLSQYVVHLMYSAEVTTLRTGDTDLRLYVTTVQDG